MTNLFVTSDLHLGKTHSSVDLSAELDRYIDWMCKQAEDYLSLDDKILVVNGDFFDTKKFLTIKQKKQAETILDRLNQAFDRVFFNLGNHDIPGRADLTESLFDFFVVIHENFAVISTPTTLDLGNVRVRIYPYGTFSQDEEGVICLTHENMDVLKSDTKREIINGHIHTHFVEGNITNLGTPYQLDWGDVGNPGGLLVIDEDGTVERIKYERSTFRRVYLEAGKIDGKNPVKWLTENKKDLEGTCLEVIVAEDVDKTLYSKFIGVLGTVNLSEVKLTENISFTPDKPMSSSKLDFATSVEPLLSREGSKIKIRDILNVLGA